CLAWERVKTPPLPPEKGPPAVARNSEGGKKKREKGQQTKKQNKKKKREPTQKNKHISNRAEAQLLHAEDGNTDATVKVSEHQESFATNSRAFSRWLTHEYGERHPMTVRGKFCPSAPSTQALTEAINALTAKAARGAKHQAAVRVAGHGELIYLDLG